MVQPFHDDDPKPLRQIRCCDCNRIFDEDKRVYRRLSQYSGELTCPHCSSTELEEYDADDLARTLRNIGRHDIE